MNNNQWTLTEIARLLHQPQHRLIYLCEKGVIKPDFSDAHGRGSSRRFSAKNIFEFSTALVLSEFHFPATMSANFLYTIRSFETSVRESLNDFRLPDALMDDQSPEIIGIVTNGSLLYFSLGFPGKLKKVFGGIDISEVSKSNDASIANLDSQVTVGRTEEHGPLSTGSSLARFEINLTKVAQNLKLD